MKEGPQIQTTVAQVPAKNDPKKTNAKQSIIHARTAAQNPKNQYRNIHVTQEKFAAKQNQKTQTREVIYGYGY